MAKYFRLFIVILLFTSCSKEDIVPIEQLSIQLDGRLPMDSNGYYHLKLNPYSNQTIHRISGSVQNNEQPIKVEWESNLYWWLMKGDTIANITKTYTNYYTGELTYVNLPPFLNWKNELVPTINPTCYSDKDNEINTVIAPIYRMKNDTLVVIAKVNESRIIQMIKIVLE